MGLFKYSSVVVAALLSIGVAQASTGGFKVVPFHNVPLDAYTKLYANYTFDAHKQRLVCTTDKASRDAITSVEWVYKDATRKIDMPVSLKDDAKFKGYYADPSGQLVITNEFGVGPSMSGTIYVSCDYLTA